MGRKENGMKIRFSKITERIFTNKYRWCALYASHTKIRLWWVYRRIFEP